MGAGEFSRRVLLPPAGCPVLVALGLIEFSYFWNDLLGPLIYNLRPPRGNR